MSVAVSRQPQLSSFSRSPTRVHNPARSSPVLARGIIRLPKDISPIQQGPRQAKPRHRRSPKSSATAPKPTANAGDKEDELIQPLRHHNATPKRPIKDAAGSRKPITPSAPRRNVHHTPKTPANPSSQAETTTLDTSDSDVSQPHTRPELPSTPSPNISKKRPATSPSSFETNGNKEKYEGNGNKNSRSRRGGHKSAQMPALVSAAMPIPVGGRGQSAARAPIPAQFMSRSVPLSSSAGKALPDWDMPPSFSTITDPFIVDPEEQAGKPTRASRSMSPEAGRPLPWLEIQDDDDFPLMSPPSTPPASNAKSHSTSNLLLPSRHSNTTPRRSGRPVNRHARTVSVPSLSTQPLVQREQQPPSPVSPKFADGHQVKYAGGRFQSAPAPTFLPMPTFAI